MEFKDFNKELCKIIDIAKYEDKLDAIEAEYPPMSLVAADLLEYAVTGNLNGANMVAWWLYELNCGAESGELFMRDGNSVTIQTAEDLWNLLHNEVAYSSVCYPDWEQMEIEDGDLVID